MAKQGRASYTLYYDNYVASGHYMTMDMNWTVQSVDGVTNSSTLKVDYICKSSINATLRHDHSSFELDGITFHEIGRAGWESDDTTIELPANTPVTIYSGIVNVQHTSTAAQNFSLYWGMSADIYVSNLSATPQEGWSTGETFFVLDAIVRSAFIEAILDGLTTCTDEDPLNILYSNPMQNEATLLQAGISISNGAEMEVPYRDISKTGTVYTFNLTTSEWAAIYAKTLDKKITSCPIRFYIKSTVPVLDGNSYETVVDYREGTMSFINYLPTLNPTFKDVNPVTVALTGNENVFIRYASNVQFNLNASAKKQAKLTNYYAANGDNTVFATSGVLEAVTGEEFIAQVYDNRGYYASYIEEHTKIKGNWIEYVPLTCKVKNGLLDANGNLVVTISGKYFAGSFGSESNTLSLMYNIRKNGAADNWRYITASNIQPDSQNNYTYSFTIHDLDYTDRYLLTVCATDKINQEGSTTETIIGAVPVFDWGKNDFAFYVPVTINGASVPSIVEQDKSGIWTYRKWSDGNAECWGKVSFNSPVTSTLGSLYTTGARYESNVTFPFEFAEIPVVTATMDSKQAACWLIASANTAASDKTSTTSTGRYEVVRPTSLSNGAFTINYYVRGKWQ